MKDFVIGSVALLVGVAILIGIIRVVVSSFQLARDGRPKVKLFGVMFGCLAGMLMSILLLAVALGSFFPSIR